MAIVILVVVVVLVVISSRFCIVSDDVSGYFEWEAYGTLSKEC